MFSIARMKELLLLSLILFFLLFVAMTAFAEEQTTVVYQATSVGTAKYNKPIAVVKGTTVYSTNSVGAPKAPVAKIVGGRIYGTDSVGNVRYNQPKAVAVKRAE